MLQQAIRVTWEVPDHKWYETYRKCVTAISGIGRLMKSQRKAAERVRQERRRRNGDHAALVLAEAEDEYGNGDNGGDEEDGEEYDEEDGDEDGEDDSEEGDEEGNADEAASENTNGAQGGEQTDTENNN